MDCSEGKGQVLESLGSSVGVRNGHFLQDRLRKEPDPAAACCLTALSRPETWPRGPGALPAEGAGFAPFSWRIGVLASRQVLCLFGARQALSAWLALLLSPTSTPSTNFLCSFLSSLDG